MDGNGQQLAIDTSSGLWQQYVMALDRVTQRLQRITGALQKAGVPYALAGGQAVAMWVASRDPAAVRTTKDVDLLVNRDDLPRIRRAGVSVELDYFETMGVGMLLDRSDPNPRHAVHLIWAGEKVRPHEAHPVPTLERTESLDGMIPIVSLGDLVLMKLLANRDQDRVHLRDLIDVGLIDRSLCEKLPADMQPQLDGLLSEAGR